MVTLEKLLQERNNYNLNVYLTQLSDEDLIKCQKLIMLDNNNNSGIKEQIYFEILIEKERRTTKYQSLENTINITTLKREYQNYNLTNYLKQLSNTDLLNCKELIITDDILGIKEHILSAINTEIEYRITASYNKINKKTKTKINKKI